MNKGKRICRICIYLLVSVISFIFLYFSSDLTYMSPEMAMRREEAAKLVGPSRIIAYADVNYGTYDRMILGETDYGYTLFEYSEESGGKFGTLTYHEKASPLTCFSTSIYSDLITQGSPMPVYVIAQDSRAASARLTLNTRYASADESFEQTHTAESQLQQDTFFLFEVDITDMDHDACSFWVYRLNGINSYLPRFSGSAVIELFDSGGYLIDTVVLEFPSLG